MLYRKVINNIEYQDEGTSFSVSSINDLNIINPTDKPEIQEEINGRKVLYMNTQVLTSIIDSYKLKEFKIPGNIKVIEGISNIEIKLDKLEFNDNLRIIDSQSLSNFSIKNLIINQNFIEAFKSKNSYNEDYNVNNYKKAFYNIFSGSKIDRVEIEKGQYVFNLRDLKFLGLEKAKEVIQDSTNVYDNYMKIDVSSNTLIIQDLSFDTFSKTKKIIFPNSIQKQDYKLVDKESLKKLSEPSFSKDIEEITIGTTDKLFEKDFFKDYSKLKKITILEAVDYSDLEFNDAVKDTIEIIYRKHIIMDIEEGVVNKFLYSRNQKHLEIPQFYDGHKIKAIGSNSFMNENNLETILILDPKIVLEENSFSNLPHLKKLNIYNNKDLDFNSYSDNLYNTNQQKKYIGLNEATVVNYFLKNIITKMTNVLGKSVYKLSHLLNDENDDELLIYQSNFKLLEPEVFKIYKNVHTIHLPNNFNLSELTTNIFSELTNLKNILIYDYKNGIGSTQSPQKASYDTYFSNYKILENKSLNIYYLEDIYEFNDRNDIVGFNKSLKINPKKVNITFDLKQTKWSGVILPNSFDSKEINEISEIGVSALDKYKISIEEKAFNNNDLSFITFGVVRKSYTFNNAFAGNDIHLIQASQISEFNSLAFSSPDLILSTKKFLFNIINFYSNPSLSLKNLKSNIDHSSNINLLYDNNKVDIGSIGLKVSQIQPYAFASNDNTSKIEQISLPDSLINIKEKAFYNHPENVKFYSYSYIDLNNEYNRYKYEIREDSDVELNADFSIGSENIFEFDPYLSELSFEGNEDNLYIPDYYGDYPVTKITSIKNESSQVNVLSLPSTLLYINDNAFNGLKASTIINDSNINMLDMDYLEKIQINHFDEIEQNTKINQSRFFVTEDINDKEIKITGTTELFWTIYNFVNIPATINDKIVAEIADNAFEYKDSYGDNKIVSVSFDRNISNIIKFGKDVFKNNNIKYKFIDESFMKLSPESEKTPNILNDIYSGNPITKQYRILYNNYSDFKDHYLKLAEDRTSSTIYQIFENESFTKFNLVRYDTKNENLIIPAFPSWYKYAETVGLKSLLTNSIYNQESIKTIFIPDDINLIEEKAVSNLVNLETINMSKKFSHIDQEHSFDLITLKKLKEIILYGPDAFFYNPEQDGKINTSIVYTVTDSEKPFIKLS
jgi:hypothetical protein